MADIANASPQEAVAVDASVEDDKSVQRGADGRYSTSDDPKKRRSNRESGSTKPRGAKPLNFSHYLCRRIWSNAVNLRQEIAWSRSDETFIPEELQKDVDMGRIFYRIAMLGYDPRSIKHKENRIDLVTLVGKTEGFAYTVNLFESEFWKMLAESAPAIEVTEEKANVLLRKLGLFQIGESDRQLGAKLYPDEPAFFRPNFESADTSAVWSDEELTFDHIALLMCNFRLALSHRDFVSLHFCMQSIYKNLNILLGKLKIPAILQFDLNLLIYKRIILDRPPADREADFLSLESNKDSKRSRQARLEENPIHNDLFRFLVGGTQTRSVIVAMNATTSFFSENLYKLWREHTRADVCNLTDPEEDLPMDDRTQKILAGMPDVSSIFEDFTATRKRGRPRGSKRS